MDIHEYQAKELLAGFGVGVPKGGVAYSADQAVYRAVESGGSRWVVKAQIHSGARGKAGGVRLCAGDVDVRQAAKELLGKTLVTAQTGPDGLPVHRLLVEEALPIARELYLGLVLDRGRERIVVVAHPHGGMEIEEIAQREPEAILREVVEPAVGIRAFQGRELAFGLELAPPQVNQAVSIILGAYRAFRELDATMVEINPLVVTKDGQVLALDVKMSFDDNAMFRRPSVAELRDYAQEDPREAEAAEHGLNYVALDGDKRRGGPAHPPGERPADHHCRNARGSGTAGGGGAQRGARGMSILLDETTRVVIQGFTGDKGTFHAKEMIAYGTNVVGGVTPGKGGTAHLGRPVFNTVKEAVAATEATASLVPVPAPFCADAIMEAADAGIRLVVTITDGVPAQDMMTVKRYLWRYARERRTRLIGPNCAGVISPGKAMMGIMPGHIYLRGAVGVVTRSGTLGYEAAAQMQALGVGITTSVGIGGDPINGSSFVDLLALFEEDPETDAVMMIGEIGGRQEADAARFVKEHMTKPVIGYVAGLTAPKGRRMGHAGAIISAFGDTAAEKAEIMRSAGLVVAPSPAELGSTVAQALARRPPRPVLVAR